VLVLADDAFKVGFARQPEQPLAIRFNVVAVQEPLAAMGQDKAAPCLTFDERKVTQVVALYPERVEGVEAGLTTPNTTPATSS